MNNYAPVNGARLYYEDVGSGPTLLFVHAGIADSRMWDTQVTAFADRYRCIRFDQRGFGKSLPVEGEYTFREDLAALIDYLKLDRLILVGCSMGGGSCVDYALDYANRVHALVLVGSAPGGLEVEWAESPLEKEIELAYEAKDWDRAAEVETRLWFDGEGRTPQDVDAAARAALYEMNLNAIQLQAAGLGTRKPSREPAAAMQLDRLTLPMLVVYGDRDELYIRNAAEYMKQHLVNARVHLMPNTAHLPNMERPTDFNQILEEFLNEVAEA